jgi:preprotein translocase subunit SecA
VLLSVLDRKWREHLYEMDYLRAGIHLRAMANRDPVVEYQREGFDMFNAMLDGIKEESVGFLFNLEVKTKEQQEAEAAAAQAEAAQKQAQAEAEALVRAQAGTEAVLARQAAAAKAAAAPTSNGNGRVAAPAPASNGNGTGTTAGSARRTRKAAPAAASAAPAAAPVAKGTGTGPELAVKGLEAPKQAPLSYSAPTLDASAKESGPAKAAKSATVTGTKETPRNAPCPCGSGKKYKQCHGAAGN